MRLSFSLSIVLVSSLFSNNILAEDLVKDISPKKYCRKTVNASLAGGADKGLCLVLGKLSGEVSLDGRASEAVCEEVRSECLSKNVKSEALQKCNKSKTKRKIRKYTADCNAPLALLNQCLADANTALVEIGKKYDCNDNFSGENGKPSLKDSNSQACEELKVVCPKLDF